MKAYMQLTQEQRYQIHALMKAEQSQTEIAKIAKIVGVDKSTISREVPRNQGLRGYRPQQAHRLALHRRQAKVQPRLTSGHWRLIERQLRADWSPEQISLWLAQEQQSWHENTESGIFLYQTNCCTSKLNPRRLLRKHIGFKSWLYSCS